MLTNIKKKKIIIKKAYTNREDRKEKKKGFDTQKIYKGTSV